MCFQRLIPKRVKLLSTDVRFEPTVPRFGIEFSKLLPQFGQLLGRELGYLLLDLFDLAHDSV